MSYVCVWLSVRCECIELLKTMRVECFVLLLPLLSAFVIVIIVDDGIQMELVYVNTEWNQLKVSVFPNKWIWNMRKRTT